MYDAGTKPAAYLREYAREFSSVEVDSTFYGTPPPERLAKWAQSVPPAFTFALKLPRDITHDRRLVGCEELSDAFFASASTLGPQLEAVLVQLGADFSPAEWPGLAAFLSRVPAGMRVALELRDPAWFDGAVAVRLLGLLEERGIALAAVDGGFVPVEQMLALFARPTAGFAYVRWLGRRETYARFDRVAVERRADLARWAAALQQAAERVEHICGYANNQYMGHSPGTIRAIMEAAGLVHERPARIVQDSLFGG